MAITNGTRALRSPEKPEYGRRLVVNIIDDTARNDPERECFQIPRSSNPKDGWSVITYKQFADAVNYVARWLVETCGEPPKDAFPTIAYIGPNDARYLVMMIATVKAGYKILFISPRNSLEGQINLFELMDCNILCYPECHRTLVQPWLQKREMKTLEAATVNSWFSHEGDVPHFPYDKTFEEAEWDPLFVLHTSGSTGFPKPVVIRQGTMAVNDGHHHLPEFNGERVWIQAMADKSKRHFTPMPIFHAAGSFGFVIFAIYYGAPIVLGIPDAPITADSVAECLEHIDVEFTLLPPAIVEEMSKSETGIEALKKMKHVAFGGGNLAEEAGNRLVKNGVTIFNLISTTECGFFPLYWQPNQEFWNHFIIKPDAFGCEMRPVAGEENVYEMVFVRQAKNVPRTQGCFYTFPDKDEWPSNDLYIPHPTLAHHWRYHGRADDIIVFSNGEKLNPVTIESIVRDHPQIKGAIVVGSDRFQPGLLLEPVAHPKNEAEEQMLIDSVLPLVVEANRITVAHGRIDERFIALSRPDKPFLRAGKGTVQRAGTVKMYKNEIDALYEKAGQGQLSKMSKAPDLDVSSEEALARSIGQLFKAQLEGAKLELDTDFFSVGVDSLQIINTSRMLRAGLEKAGCHADPKSLTPRVIYANPTLRRLAHHLFDTVISSTENGVNGTPNGTSHELHVMETLYKKYTKDLRLIRPRRPGPSDQNQTVILTGSTGMLGSYLIDQLIKAPAVKRVVCLNRTNDGGVRQQARAMKERGLEVDYEHKVEFHHIDISQPEFGLSQDVYSRLLQEADRFIHNAWPVNFNMPVESFEPQLQGIRNISTFAAHAEKRTAIIFISSIGSVEHWDATNKGPVPESRLEDPTLPAAGYGRSKMLSSLILEDAGRAANFPTAVIRVGQIAGPERGPGVWNRHEWLPSIVASSLYLGALPRDLGFMDRVDWTPVERVASLVLETAGVLGSTGDEDVRGYYHGVNPAATSWGELVGAVRDFYGAERIGETVGFREWVDRLERSQQSDDDDDAVDAKNPGVKLIDTYRSWAVEGREPVVFDMERTMGRSPTMRASGAVTGDLMRRWCEQWGF